jgi:hypothetical protein
VLSIYLDTSVVGGFFDVEFMTDTRALWRLRDAGHFRFVSSQLVFQEANRAPEPIRRLLHETFAPLDVLERTFEAENLAAAYVAQKVVPEDFADDARHVAICASAKIEYLVSWNFRHLANVRREAAFNAVNLLQGYPSVRIVTPTFLVHGCKEEDF